MLRTVLPVADTDVFKALYYDREHAALRPNLTFVDRTGAIVFETNEVGLKGDPVDASRKLAVVWGQAVWKRPEISVLVIPPWANLL
jgi:hypothetical protein